VLVAATGIFGSDDPRRAACELRALVGEAT
jgi:hypothetical protein